MVEPIGELQRMHPVAAARAEAAWLEGDPGPLDEVVTFEGLFCGAAAEGEEIRVIGHLEAEHAGGRRLVVGSGFLPDGGSLRLTRSRTARA